MFSDIPTRMPSCSRIREFMARGAYYLVYIRPVNYIISHENRGERGRPDFIKKALWLSLGDNPRFIKPEYEEVFGL